MLQDENVFEGTFGKVQKVTIHETASIPEWIEFAGKTMKVEKNKENRLQWSAEALACPVDHLGVIKLLYLNTKTYESYSMWWNGGSLMNMMAHDRTIERPTRTKSSNVQVMILKLGRVWSHIGSTEHI